jgi:hypothetical protein
MGHFLGTWRAVADPGSISIAVALGGKLLIIAMATGESGLVQSAVPDDRMRPDTWTRWPRGSLPCVRHLVR